MYSSVTDIRNTILDLESAVMADEQVTYWIGKADNVINSRLAELYEVPFTTTPDIVNDISIFLTAYYCTRVVFNQTTAEKNTWVEGFKEQAMALLEDIRSGKTTVIDSDGSIVPKRTNTGARISTEYYRPVFNEGDETNWNISPQKQENEEGKY